MAAPFRQALVLLIQHMGLQRAELQPPVADIYAGNNNNVADDVRLASATPGLATLDNLSMQHLGITINAFMNIISNQPLGDPQNTLESFNLLALRFRAFANIWRMNQQNVRNTLNWFINNQIPAAVNPIAHQRNNQVLAATFIDGISFLNISLLSSSGEWEEALWNSVMWAQKCFLTFLLHGPQPAGAAFPAIHLNAINGPVLAVFRNVRLDIRLEYVGTDANGLPFVGNVQLGQVYLYNALNNAAFQFRFVNMFLALWHRFANSWNAYDNTRFWGVHGVRYNFFFVGPAADLQNPFFNNILPQIPAAGGDFSNIAAVSKMKSIIKIGPSPHHDCIPMALAVLFAHKDYYSQKATKMLSNEDKKQLQRQWDRIRKMTPGQKSRRELSLQLFKEVDKVSNRGVQFQQLKKYARVLQSDIVVFHCLAGFPIIFHTQEFQLSPNSLEDLSNWDEYEDSRSVGKKRKRKNADETTLLQRQIFQQQHSLYCLLYESKREDDDNVDIDEGHCHAIVNPGALLGKICAQCGKAYSKSHLKCTRRCSYCFELNCYEEDEVADDEKKSWVHCENCNRKFPSTQCFQNHATQNCNLYFRCLDPQCNGQVFPSFQANALKGVQLPWDQNSLGHTHEHGKILWCHSCACWVFKHHVCCIKQEKKHDIIANVFYADFECFVDKTTNNHIVNFAVVQQVSWMNEDGSITPNDAVQNQFVFTSIESFCNWLCSEDRLGSVVVFHNGRSYDFHFIRNFLLQDNSMWHFDCIKRGLKIISMTLSPKKSIKKKKNQTVTLLDSISFLSSSLNQLAKLYGVSNKGYFPHRFNQPQNFTYEGEIPPVDSFFEDSDEFLQWHQEQVDKKIVWNFQEEIRKYCIQDVNILRLVFETFRKKVYETLQTECLCNPTLPALASHIYFSSFYDPTVNALQTPSNEYTEWARGAMFGGRTNAIKLKYECLPGEKIKYVDVTSLYPAVLVKNFFPLTKGTFMEIPETEQTEVNRFIEGYLSDHFIQSGGLAILECEVLPPKGLYFPVLPNRKMTWGEAEKAFLQSNGFKGEKLLFHLQQQRGKWTSVELALALKKGYRLLRVFGLNFWLPSETSNTLWRDYVLFFLKKKTLANGKKKILEAYRKNTGNPEASWSEYVHTYNDYYNRLCQTQLPADLQLSLHEAVPENRNSADYAINKLFLNSLWGRFSMRNDFYNHSLIKLIDRRDVSLFQNKLLDPLLHTEWDFLTNQYIELRSRVSDPLQRPLPRKTNVNVGIFTTSYARTYLYHGLNLLGRSVLYHDTDSIIYVETADNEKVLPLGDFLGEWTDELDGHHITKFYAAGPKNYAFEDSKGQQYIKCKGFNMKKKEVNQVITLDLFKSSVDEFQKPETKRKFKEQIIQFKLEQGGVISRDKTGQVFSSNAEKMWRCVYTKRQVIESDTHPHMIDTLPFGFFEEEKSI